MPLGALLAACGDDDEALENLAQEAAADPERRGEPSSPPEATGTPAQPTLTPTPTITPTPFIPPAGEDGGVLMPGTPYETPYFSFATGTLGPILMVLGGVHGNEPGGWLASERIAESVRPDSGALLVLPRANVQAINLFERTTDELGDLNRLYPGDPNGLPMARMAHEIVETLRAYHVSHVLDLHESWSFYRDRTDTQTGTAYLGQTLSSPGEPGASLAREVVETVNSTRIQAVHEELVFREWPPRGGFPFTPVPGSTDVDTSNGQRRSRSSLGLPVHIPGISAILVEMGQQQDLERRIQLHVDVVQEAMRILGARL